MTKRILKKVSEESNAPSLPKGEKFIA